MLLVNFSRGSIMFEKLSNSFALARSSWGVLCTDKKLLIFPVLSGIACLVVMASFAAPVLFLVMQNPQRDFDFEKLPPALSYGLLFAFYFLTYFVVIFFNSALTSCALIRFNGGEPTIGAGLQAAVARLPQILAWTLVAATVGVLLKVVENSHEQVGRFIRSILGTAWSVVTFFVVPVLVVENVGPFAALGRSVAILKRTWGEALIGNFGMGLFTFVLAIPFVLLVVVAMMLFSAAPALLPVAVLVLVLAAVYFLLLMAVSSAMNNIFVAAVYQFAAQGAVPAGFNERIVRHAFGAKGTLP
jgi:Family of unknown function (DUF6159)